MTTEDIHTHTSQTKYCGKMSGIEFFMEDGVELAYIPATHPMIGAINSLLHRSGREPLRKEDEIKPGFYLCSGDTVRKLLSP